jgi:hypothetical protein
VGLAGESWFSDYAGLKASKNEKDVEAAIFAFNWIFPRLSEPTRLESLFFRFELFFKLNFFLKKY